MCCVPLNGGILPVLFVTYITLTVMPPSVSIMQSRRFSFESATLWALLVTLGATSIFFTFSFASVPLGPTKAFLLIIGSIVTLACFVLARLSRGNIILPPPLLLGALWLPTVAYLLSSVFGGVGFDRAFLSIDFSLDTLGLMTVMSVLGTLAALAFRRDDHYKLFFKGILIIGLLVVGLQTLFVVAGQFVPGFISPSSSILGSMVDLASIAGLAVIGALISFRFLTIDGRTRIALFALAALSLFLLALLGARIEWIIIALVSLGFFVEAVMRRSPSAVDSDLDGAMVVAEAEMGPDGGERSLALPLLTLAVALFFLLGGNLSSVLATALKVNVLDVRPSWQSTIDIGKQIYTSPSLVFGTGPTSFGSEWLKYRDPAVNQTLFWNVDFPSGVGFIPTSLVTTGLVGALAWILFALAILYFGVRALLLKSIPDPFLRFVATFSFVGAVYLALIAVLANAGLVSVAMLFVFTGIFASSLRHVPGKTQWGIIFAKSPRLGFVIVFVLTIVLLASIAGAYTVVERYLASLEVVRSARAIAELQSSQSLANDAPLLEATILQARAGADNSIALLPSSTAYRLKAQAAQAELARMLRNGNPSQQAVQAELSSGISAAVEATRLAPDEYQNWLVLGELYKGIVPLNVAGAYDNAVSAYERAVELNPTSAPIHYTLGELHISGGKTDEARTELTTAITLKQDYTLAIFLLSQLEVSTGRIKEALQAAEAAAYFAPNDPTVLFQVGVLRAANADYIGAQAALTALVTQNPGFANARYFLAALYARARDYQNAKMQIEAIAGMSAENAAQVASVLKDLGANKNPFPSNLFENTPLQ